MPMSRFRLGASAFAAGSLAMLAGRFLFAGRAAPALPAAPEPDRSPREWESRGPQVALADPAAHDPSKGEGHPAPELAADMDVSEVRADPHFRPDPTAVPTAEEREALRPAPPLESAAHAVADSERAVAG